jgi:hypothetical protein
MTDDRGNATPAWQPAKDEKIMIGRKDTWTECCWSKSSSEPVLNILFVKIPFCKQVLRVLKQSTCRWPLGMHTARRKRSCLHIRALFAAGGNDAGPEDCLSTGGSGLWAPSATAQVGTATVELPVVRLLFERTYVKPSLIPPYPLPLPLLTTTAKSGAILCTQHPLSTSLKHATSKQRIHILNKYNAIAMSPAFLFYFSYLFSSSPRHLLNGIIKHGLWNKALSNMPLDLYSVLLVRQ